MERRRPKRWLGAWAGAVALAIVPGVAAGQSFRLIENAPGQSDGRVYGLSADGTRAAGFSTNHSNTPSPAFVWSAESGRQDFSPDFGPASKTQAYAISGSGSTLVGQSREVGQGLFHAFRWSGPGTYQRLDPLGTPQASQALGVSGDGAVVVGKAYTNLGPIEFSNAFRWTSAGGMQPLGYTNPNHYHSVAFGVSRDGSSIVGESRAGSGDAFVWREGAGLVALPHVPGTTIGGSSARATNYDGSIIVGYSGPLGTWAMWRDGQPTNLGGPGGIARGE